ncbi:hypothetical protein GH714_042593 [Hevea brasiliensis]|uniref:Uncharacterized protein n=1 Tax=Hevea brasiliensis TaxID=3981 RepID=A0A6A6K2Z3_HEVBR|nr:hypothetical protein GH714_042593 [Hevea brasiliensis]
MRVTGPKSSDPNQVTSIVVTENHNFIVRGTHNKEVGTLEAEVQYTVTPTIEQDKYTVSDLTVKIKSTDSTDPELTYTSTNTSEVSLPKPEAIRQRRDNKILEVVDMVQELAQSGNGRSAVSGQPTTIPANVKDALKAITDHSDSGCGSIESDALEKLHTNTLVFVENYICIVEGTRKRSTGSGQSTAATGSSSQVQGAPTGTTGGSTTGEGVLHLAQVEAQKVPPPHRQHPEAYSMAPRLDKHNKRELLRVSQKAS